ncbi:MAG TPA: hypothetical protein VIY90_22840 [Steroidobacteraceae bacterium]
MINEAFAEGLSMPSSMLLSRPTVHFFGTLSRVLQAFNVSLAASVARGSLLCLQDSSLVRLEQAVVQRHLASLYLAEGSAYIRLIDEANRGLHFVGTLARLSASHTSVATLGKVLRQLQGNGGKAINFARRTDREAIGNALIVSVTERRRQFRSAPRARQPSPTAEFMLCRFSQNGHKRKVHFAL